MDVVRLLFVQVQMYTQMQPTRPVSMLLDVYVRCEVPDLFTHFLSSAGGARVDSTNSASFVTLACTALQLQSGPRTAQ